MPYESLPMDEKSLEIERAGYEAGFNPLFGEWRRTFNFTPVSYANKSELKSQFKERLRSELKTGFVFNHQVTLTITLYLNHEKILETPEYGDLDNYAKTICDAIKGKGGVLIDDCQIQRIDISWIDVPKKSYFEIELRASPDDFSSDNIALYEMSDGLFYPVSLFVWEEGKFVKAPPVNMYFQLEYLAAITSIKRTLRHQARLEGVPQFRAFQYGRRVSPIQWAFHQTRVANSGFALIRHAAWKIEHEQWAATAENAERAKTISELVANYKASLAAAVGITNHSTGPARNAAQAG